MKPPNTSRRPVGLAAALLVPAVLAVPGPARGALVTDVADAADKDDPVDVNVDVTWTRLSRRGKVSREFFDPSPADPAAAGTKNATELLYQRVSHIMDVGLTFGLYHDLEIRGRLPYALYDEQSWDYDKQPTYQKASSTMENNNIDADNRCLDVACTKTRPLVVSPGRVFRGGLMDPSVGIAWGPLNDQRDEHLPASMFPFLNRSSSLVLGFDYTMPLVSVASPLAADPANPSADPANTDGLGMGLGAHRFDWWLAMSKRVGVVEPFLKLHYTLPVAGSGAYDNCSAAKVDFDDFVMSESGHKSCNPVTSDGRWKDRAGLQYPHRGGLTAGTEFIPVEEKGGTVRLAVAVAGAAEYISQGRTYSEASDALHKLTMVEPYFQVDAKLQLDLRLGEYVHLLAGVWTGTETSHFVTSESVGKDFYGENPSQPSDGRVLLGSSEQNPNYDYRVDQPGRRLRFTGVWNLGVSTMFSLTF